MKKEILLGVPIHALRWADLKTVLFQFLHSREPHMLVTLNPEILVHASRDDAYRTLLHRADLLIADGAGLRIITTLFSWISKRYTPLPATLPGVDVALWLLDVANHEQYAVTCVVWEKGRTSADILQHALASIAPHARIQCVTSSHEPAQNILHTIAEHEPQILFVGFGAPFQEQWLSHALPELPSVRIAMGVGGTFDYWTGIAQRAPRWMRALGFEWLWRVMREPRRMRRIMRAVMVFPYLAFKNFLHDRRGS